MTTTDDPPITETTTSRIPPREHLVRSVHHIAIENPPSAAMAQRAAVLIRESLRDPEVEVTEFEGRLFISIPTIGLIEAAQGDTIIIGLDSTGSSVIWTSRKADLLDAVDDTRSRNIRGYQAVVSLQSKAISTMRRTVRRQWWFILALAALVVLNGAFALARVLGA